MFIKRRNFKALPLKFFQTTQNSWIKMLLETISVSKTETETKTSPDSRTPSSKKNQRMLANVLHEKISTKTPQIPFHLMYLASISF
jgi:hypothetical protein